MFATLNNYQRGDFKPYVMKSTDRGRTWTSVAGDLPQRSGAWSIVQDHVNGDLLFAGLEFGVWFTVDGGQHWMQLKGGMPTTQARDLTIQRRENDLVVGSFGRGAFVLDDYSALRDLTPQALTEAARLFPFATLTCSTSSARRAAAWGNVATPNPPYGAVVTYSIGQPLPADAKLVLNVADASGRAVRRMELPRDPGLHRAAWNLRADPPPPTAEGGRGGRGGPPLPRQADDGEGDEQEQEPPAGGGRGQAQGQPVPAGRYRVTLARVSGDTVTPIGQPQTLSVVALPR